MSALLAERGISHQPEAIALDELNRKDIERIAKISGGSLATNHGQIYGISYQEGETFLSLPELFGVYRDVKLGTREGYFRMPTPAVLFRDGSIVFVCPKDYYYEGPIVNRTVTLSEGDVIVKDIAADESLPLDADIAHAAQIAEEYRVGTLEIAVRNSLMKHSRRRR